MGRLLWDFAEPMGFLRMDVVIGELGDKVSPLKVETLLDMLEGGVDAEMLSEWLPEVVLDSVCFLTGTVEYESMLSTNSWFSMSSRPAGKPSMLLRLDNAGSQSESLELWSFGTLFILSKSPLIGLSRSSGISCEARKSWDSGGRSSGSSAGTRVFRIV